MNPTPENLKAKGYTEVSPGDWRKLPTLPPVPGEPEIVHEPASAHTSEPIKAAHIASGEPEISEKELQRQLSQLLNLRGIWFTRSRTDKRATNVVGTPDFLFAINGKATAWECKVGGGQLSDEQKKTRATMTDDKNKWDYEVITSTAQAFQFLKERGL